MDFCRDFFLFIQLYEEVIQKLMQLWRNNHGKIRETVINSLFSIRTEREPVIQKLDHASIDTAATILEVQILAYKVEAEYIKNNTIPRLYDTVGDIQNCDETFYGYWIRGHLAGFISFVNENNVTEIHRLVVSPNHFHKGIASALLQYTFQLHPSSQFIVQTGKENVPAVALYQKHGFIKKQEFTVHDELVLVQLEKTK